MLRDTDTMRNEVAGPQLISAGGRLDPGLVLPPALLASVRAPTSLSWGENDPFGGPDVSIRGDQRPYRPL